MNRPRSAASMSLRLQKFSGRDVVSDVDGVVAVGGVAR